MIIQPVKPNPIRISPSIKYLTQEYYKTYYDEYWTDNHYYKYTFVEWYFFYTRKLKLNHYKHTPTKLITMNLSDCLRVDKELFSGERRYYENINSNV